MKTVRGTLTKILSLKYGNGTEYRRVTFKLADGSWAKTDICPKFRNYAAWRSLLKVGNILANLELRDPRTVNADSHPRLVGREPQPDDQMKLL